MANEHLVRCRGAALSCQEAAWRKAPELVLCLGGSGDDVRLRVRRLSEATGRRVPDVGLDLLELAAFVYAADQALTRGGPNRLDYGACWRRRLRFEVPVRRPEVWRRAEVSGALVELLSFLTEDDYEFGFSLLRDPPPMQNYLFDVEEDGGAPVEEVVLFSGGQDSLAGAVREALECRRKVALVSHRPVSKVYARQRRLAKRLRDLQPDWRLRAQHVAVEVNKGRRLSRGFTQRSRSFLFASMAAVMAAICGLRRVRFYENGVVSFNLPLSPQVVGCRASRTTHPRALAAMGRFFSALFERAIAVDNPFLWMTRTQVLRSLRASGHGELSALTSSCAHTHQASDAQPQCGRCSQCLDRRVGSLAAGLSDAEDPASRYRSDPLTGAREGADLVLIERYLGASLAVERLQGPEGFLAAYPDASRALPFLGMAPDAGLAEMYELHRRHARSVLGAVTEEARRLLDGVVRRQVPANCLVSLACAQAQVGPGPAPPAPAPPPGLLCFDEERFEACFGDRRCFLGNTNEWTLLRRLNATSGTYLSLDQLRSAVWGEDEVAVNTIQRTVSNLRRKLAVFTGVEIDGKQSGHYCLRLPGPSSVSA